VKPNHKPNLHSEDVKEGEKLIGLQLSKLSDNFAALGKLRKTATANHILSSIKMSLLQASKGDDYIIDRLVEDLQAHVPWGVMQKAVPALSQVIQHFLMIVSQKSYGALKRLPGPPSIEDELMVTSLNYIYKLTEKFSYDSLELISTLEMIFHQAFSEILEVTTDKEVEFLMAKGRNDQKVIEAKDSEISKLTEHVKEMNEKHKHQDRIIVELKKELKDAAKGFFREKINLRDQNIMAVEERKRRTSPHLISNHNPNPNVRNKREEEAKKRATDNVKTKLKNAFTIEAKKAEIGKLESDYKTALDHISAMNTEIEKLTPRYLTSGEDGTVERIKDKLMGEGVFLRGKKNTHETLVFVLDQLYECKKELKSCKSTLEILQENGGAGDVVDNTAVQYHSGLGMGDKVPPFLRWRGKVKYKLIGKKEAETIVRQVWAEREGNPDCSFPEHFHQFLASRYQDPQTAVEWGYNLMHALEAFKWDADCSMFLKIVREELPEEVTQHRTKIQLFSQS